MRFGSNDKDQKAFNSCGKLLLEQRKDVKGDLSLSQCNTKSRKPDFKYKIELYFSPYSNLTLGIH